MEAIVGIIDTIIKVGIILFAVLYAIRMFEYGDEVINSDDPIFSSKPTFNFDAFCEAFKADEETSRQFRELIEKHKAWEKNESSKREQVLNEDETLPEVKNHPKKLG